MIYQEATTSLNNPPMTEEQQGRFCYEFANLCTVATCINSGRVIEEKEDTVEKYYAAAYLMGWKWRMDLLMDVAKGRGWPTQEFVDFVHDMVVRLNLVPFTPTKMEDGEIRELFECVMKGRCSLTRSTDGKYAFAAQIAYEAFCKALKLGQPYVK